MPGFDIESFRAKFQAGARGYLFYVKPVFPLGIGADTDQATYLVRSSSLPESSNEEIVTQWQGFDYKTAGKKTYSPWEVTFNVDTGADLLKWYLEWSRIILDPTTNIHGSPTDYMVDQQVELLGLDGEPIIKYKMIGAWPQTVGAVALDYATSDFAQVAVTFTYQYFLVDRGVAYISPPSFAA
jgi:hypothetical protein